MKNLIFKVVFIVCMSVVAIALSRCRFDQPSFTKAGLANILETEWLAYKKDKPNFNGGLALQILSPKGNYFVSTGMGSDITNSCHFRIASVTKTFTAAGIMLLHQKGLLNINDKITDIIPGTSTPYLPNTPDYDIPYKKDITIKMLLMHRAGIFDVTNNDIPDNQFSHGAPYVGQSYISYMEEKDKEHTFTFDELVGINAKNQLSFFAPGSAYHYSDTGYSMLGKIIERVSGKSYVDFIKDELLVPNGLVSTSLPWKGSNQTMPESFAKGYDWSPKGLEEVTLSNMSPHVAEGNIISTPLDLAIWGKRLLKGEAGLNKESVAMMKEGMDKGDGTHSKYGLGLGYASGMGYGHSGAHEGYLTTLFYNPDNDVTYAIFTNIWNCQTFPQSMDSLMDEIKAMSDIANKIIKKIGY